MPKKKIVKGNWSYTVKTGKTASEMKRWLDKNWIWSENSLIAYPTSLSPILAFSVHFSASVGLKAQFLSHSSHHLLSEFRGAGIRGNKRFKGRGGNAGLNYSFKILWLESSSLEIVIEMSSGRTGLKTTWSLLWTYCVLFFFLCHPVKSGSASQRAVSFIPCHIFSLDILV